jgi:cell division protein FtsI/penicillin-binding protein 2/cell division protein FtsW (lipid II flippase)
VAERVTVSEAWQGRARERGLLLANLPLFLLAAAGVAAAQRDPAEAFREAASVVGLLWAACFGLHLLLCAVRFDGDPLILPIFSLLLLIGSAYHLDLAGPATPGLTPGAYATAALTSLGLLALITAGGRWFKRLSLLLEEKVWWRVAGDRPYYESLPFHFLLVALMAGLALLLLVGGVPSQGGSLIQVRLPGGLSFTPSELIRLAVAFFLADYLGRNAALMRRLRQPLGRVWPLNRLYFERRTELFIVLTTVGLYCLFFYAFRDFGPAAVIIALTLVSLYAATGRVLTPLLLGVLVVLAVAIPTWQNLAFHTFRNRAEMWLNPWHTDFLNGDHQARILWAIASGGWFGMGVGTQNLPGTLPLARNDAAFAGLAAGMGMWTSLAVLALFAALTWRGMLAARRAPTDRMRLLAFCLTSLLAFQAIWICGAMVRVFPFTGINVPFISTGLTSMIASTLALGAIWNLSRAATARPDATEATPEVLQGVTRLARPITAAFALPAIGVILYGCPWLLGDRTLEQTASALARGRERVAFENPYLARFRQRFPRGRVFSADGKLLAVSNPTPEEVKAVAEVSPTLAREIGSGGDGERFYPLRQHAAQLIGWTPQGRFMAQRGSIETAWDDLLRGYGAGKLPYLFRTRHNPLVRPPKPQDLQLTINADLQWEASRELADAVRQWNGAGGAAVVYDVNTGEVLCAATAPSFDPNGLTLERMQGFVAGNPRTQVLTNKPLSREARYFPGSTFKLLTAGAGLEHGVTGSVTCVGGRNAEAISWEWEGTRWRRAPGRVRDYSRAGHGPLRLQDSLQRAMSASCNVFFARMATEVGPDRFLQVMRDAELSDLPETRELAEHLDAAGYGQIVVKTAPIELAMLAGAAAAGRPDLNAAATRPHWVKAVVADNRPRDPDGLPGAPNRGSYRPFSAPTAERLRELLVAAVETPGATGHSAFFAGGAPRLPGITVGGKTGTAEFEKTVAGRRVIGRHVWFVGFARSDHEVQPRTLAFAVLIEDARRGATGGGAAAPVARRLLERILPRPGAPPPLGGGDLGGYYGQDPPTPGPLGPAIDWLKRLFRR